MMGQKTTTVLAERADRAKKVCTPRFALAVQLRRQQPVVGWLGGAGSAGCRHLAVQAVQVFFF